MVSPVTGSSYSGGGLCFNPVVSSERGKEGTKVFKKASKGS